MSAEAYYAAMDVGDYAAMSTDDLDTIGKAFCDDLGNLDSDKRKLAVLVVRDQVDDEQQAFEVAQAMSSRWCPQFVTDFDY